MLVDHHPSSIPNPEANLRQNTSRSSAYLAPSFDSKESNGVFLHLVFEDLQAETVGDELLGLG